MSSLSKMARWKTVRCFQSANAGDPFDYVRRVYNHVFVYANSEYRSFEGLGRNPVVFRRDRPSVFGQQGDDE